jgi:hypothetical protein
VTPTTITWQLDSPPFTPNKANIGGATGDFAFLAGTTVTIQSLNSVTEPVGVNLVPQPLFINFDAAPASFPTLNLGFIFFGIFSNAQCMTLPPAVGQQCTVNPPDSPFSFTNNPPAGSPQATAQFAFMGNTNDRLESWQGIFTSQFTVPYQTVLQQLATTGSVTNTFSATFTVTPVPETSSLSLLGLGLGLIGLSTRLRRKRV